VLSEGEFTAYASSKGAKGCSEEGSWFWLNAGQSQPPSLNTPQPDSPANRQAQLNSKKRRKGVFMLGELAFRHFAAG